MEFNQETLKIAIDMLSQIINKKGDFSFDKSEQSWFLKHEHESEIMEAFSFLAEEMGLIVCERNDVIYLSPGVNNSIFSMTNEEIRDRLGKRFTNIDMYASFFIMHVIISEFYRESLPDTHLVFLSTSDLLDAVDEKINAMSDLLHLDEVSEDLKFNFVEIRDLWQGLQSVQRRRENDEFVQKGKSSKLALINTTLNFMREEGLIAVSNDVIYLTDRFKAIIDRAYRHKDVHFGITEFINNFTISEDSEYAKN